MRENVESGNGGAVSILLSGAELAKFKSSANLQLFWSQGGAEEAFESEVELRSKSGISVESSAVPFSLWNRDDGFPAGLTSNAENRLRLLDSERFSAPNPPIVLKSRAVVEAEKLNRPSRAQPPDCLLLDKKTSSKHKHRAVSMDETSFNSQLRRSRRMNGGEELPPLSSRDDLLNRSGRISKKSEQNPLPLPLPPGSPAGELKPRHRRHVSIDLRASPAAKFLVQLMPWEMPEDHSSSFSGRHSSAGRCFVPFKWEEVPGKPKPGTNPNTSLNTNTNNNNTGLSFNKKLRLPPRLQHYNNVDITQPPVVSTSPTSILDHSQSSVDSSSTSSPNTTGMADLDHESEKKRFQVQSKVRAFLALVIWTRRGCEEETGKVKSGCVPKVGKKKKKKQQALMKNTASYQSISSSWSPSPRSSWFRSYSGLEIHERCNRKRMRMRMKRSSNKGWGLGKLTSGCSVVSRAVRLKWWRRSSPGVKVNRKSVYKPLLCSVENDSAAFACS